MFGSKSSITSRCKRVLITFFANSPLLFVFLALQPTVVVFSQPGSGL
jgi:hypothetical protein